MKIKNSDQFTELDLAHPELSHPMWPDKGTEFQSLELL
jgi:hypothetical protein